MVTSVLLNVLEQTSSASRSVLCASVVRTGRISCRTTVVSALRELPRGLAPGEAAADDVNGSDSGAGSHARTIYWGARQAQNEPDLAARTWERPQPDE